MQWKMRRRIVASASILLISAGSAQSQTTGFVRTYVEAHGGCGTDATLLAFETATANTRAPFGKPAEQWTDADLQELRTTLSACVPNPNGFDLSQERGILKRVAKLVDGAQRQQQAREAAASAQQKLNEAQRRREQEELEANRRAEAKRQSEALEAQRVRQDAAIEREAAFELQGFSGHLMTATEVERAQNIAQQIPGLSARVAELLAAQAGLKQRADLASQQQREREESARRVEAERRTQALADQRAAEEARIDAERKSDAFEKTLPAACREAEAGEKYLGEKVVSDKLVKAEALGEAGETNAACVALKEVVALMEKTRVAFVQCTKDLEPDTETLAQERAALTLSKAIELHTSQRRILDVMREVPCR